MSSDAPESAGPDAVGDAGGTVAGTLFNRLVTGLNGVGTIWIFVIMVLINLDVFMRYLFNAPVRGVPLVVTLSIIAIVFLQLSDALRNGRFTRSDAFIGWVLGRHPRLGHALQLGYHALGVVLMAVLFWYSVPFFEKAWTLQSYAGNEGDFTLPEWPAKLVILIGSACCCVQFMRHCWYDVRYIRHYGALARTDGGGRRP